MDEEVILGAQDCRQPLQPARYLSKRPTTKTAWATETAKRPGQPLMDMTKKTNGRVNR
jgi:hypothetical protein